MKRIFLLVIPGLTRDPAAYSGPGDNLRGGKKKKKLDPGSSPG